MGGAFSTRGKDEKIHTKFWSENLKGRGHSDDTDVDGRIILEWTLGKYDGKVRTGRI